MNESHFSITQVYATVGVEDYVRDYRDAPKFMAFCKQCRQYGRRWSCPPYAFDTLTYLSPYRHVMIVGTRLVFDEAYRHSFSSAGERDVAMNEAMEWLAEKMFSQHEIWEKQHPHAVSFAGARCFLCGDEPCSRLQGMSCRHPERVRHPLESFGFDMGKTARQLLGIELKWAEGSSLPEYLMLVSALFSPDCIESLSSPVVFGEHFSR